MSSPQQLRHALLVSSGWFQALSDAFKLDQQESQTTLRPEGKVIAQLSLADALDLADAALEPEELECM